MTTKGSGGCGLQLFLAFVLFVGLGYGVPCFRHYLYVKDAEKHIADKPLTTELLLGMQVEGLSLGDAMDKAAIRELISASDKPFYKNEWDNNKTSNKKARNTQHGFGWIVKENKLDEEHKDKILKATIEDFGKIIDLSKGISFDRATKSVKFTYQPKDQDSIMKLFESFDNNFDWDRINEFEWDRYKNFEPNMAIINYDSLIGAGEYAGIALSSLKTAALTTNSAHLVSGILKLALFASKTSPGVYGALAQAQIANNIKAVFGYVRDGKLRKPEYSGLLKAVKRYNDKILPYDKIIEAERLNTKYLLDYYFSNAFVYMYTMKMTKAKDPYAESNEIYDMAANKKLLEAKSEADSSQNRFLLKVLIPDFYSVKTAVIDHYSKMAILQAWLEDRLGQPVTAIDPIDGKPVKEGKNKNGDKIYYCVGIDEKDNQGTGDDIYSFY